MQEGAAWTMVVAVGRGRGLEVVLGKNVPYPSRSPDHNGATALATSYYADPTSAYSKLNRDGRVPMEDRKGALSQFRPKNLLINVRDGGKGTPDVFVLSNRSPNLFDTNMQLSFRSELRPSGYL